MNLHHFLARGPLQLPAVWTSRIATLGAVCLAGTACQSTPGEATMSNQVSNQVSTQVSPVAIEASASLQEPGAAEAEPVESTDDKESKGEKSLDERVDDAVEAKVLADQDASYKQVELVMARLERDAGEIEVTESLREKRAALKAAREALARYEEREMPLEVREADLSLDRSRDRLLKAQTDLMNMREIMGEEAEAKNREEIIRRYEKSSEFAQESLAIETEKRAMKVEADYPAKLLKLAGDVHAAEAKLQAEEITADTKRQSAELKNKKAKHALDASKRSQKKAQKKVSQLRKKLAGKAKDGAKK